MARKKRFDPKHPVDCILYRGENEYTVITRVNDKYAYSTYIGEDRIFKHPTLFSYETFNSELLIDHSDYAIIIRDITLPFEKATS